MIIAAAQLSLLPIVPLLLLPFAIVFFVVVFPIWGVALGVLGLALLIVRGLNAAARGKLAGAEAGTYKAFRWVLTFGGLARLAEKQVKQAPPAEGVKGAGH